MPISAHLVEDYDTRVVRSKASGSIREFQIAFDFPVDVSPEGRVEDVSLLGDSLLRLRFADGLLVDLPDADPEIAEAVLSAAKVVIAYTLADGSLRGTEIDRKAA